MQVAQLSDRQREKRRRALQDPYRAGLAAQRRAANLGLQKGNREAAAKAAGDPVHGMSTPFIRSLDTVDGAAVPTEAVADRRAARRTRASTTGAGGPQALTTSDAEDGASADEPAAFPPATPSPSDFPAFLKHLVTPQELSAAIAEGELLLRPALDSADPEANRRAAARHAADHARAVEAMRRILVLETGSARDRLVTNVQRCVATFGRHTTDRFLTQRARGPAPLAEGEDGAQAATQQQPAVVRGGLDTGSSEVQIAILTAKIRGVAQQMMRKGSNKDKHNKANLRELVHKRQKLLRYMERKERGSERWTYMLEQLGLTPATWKGQITL